MTIHYHGTPITPFSVLSLVSGRHFCVSYARPEQLRQCKKLGQSIMFDNGAFSAFRRGHQPNWKSYYSWVEKNANRHNDWAVIPDVIDGTESENDDLVNQWPHGKFMGAPVWHLAESFRRLHDLAWRGFARVCFGSSGEYWRVGSYRWMKRVESAFDLLCPRGGGQPPIAVHMLRGMSVAGSKFPFASVDSSGFARNHNRFDTPSEKKQFIDKMDCQQCPDEWISSPSCLPEAFDKRRCLYDGRHEQLEICLSQSKR